MLMRKSTWIVVGLVIVLVAVGIARRPKRQAAVVQPPVPVEVAFAATGEVVEQLSVTGNLEAQNKAEVTPQVPGRIARIYVDEGDRVRAGQVLVQLETTDYRASVTQAQAGVHAAATRLAQAQSGATLQETQSSTAVQQAQAALSAARDRLAIVRQGARRQEVAMAHSQVAQAKASHDNALANLNRMKSLLTAGAVAQQQVDAAQTGYEVAKAQYEAAQQQASLVAEGARPEEVQTAEAGVRQAEEALRLAQASVSINDVRRQDVAAARAGLEQARALLVQARDNLSRTSITSPLDGYVIDRFVDVGETVGPGAGKITLAQISSVYFEALVSENAVARVHPGQPVQVRADALPGRLFRGAVARVVPAARLGTRNFRVKVRLDNPGAVLRPGMFARGEIKVAQRSGVTLVPKDALLSEAGSNRLCLVENGQVRFVPVQVGYSDEQQAEIVSGVHPGDTLVLAGKTRVNEGDRIKVGSTLDWQPASAKGES